MKAPFEGLKGKGAKGFWERGGDRKRDIDARNNNEEGFRATLPRYLVVSDLKPYITEPLVEGVDFGKYFITDKKYSVRDDLIAWVHCEAVKLGFSVVITNSDHGSNCRKQFFVLGCERGGVYKGTKKKLKREKTGSCKCDCPFRLRGYMY
uniref:Uncharacterized protein LOC101493994 n=1 Tax=Cicer arietinum TaxID=3827 RepID=A0A1S2XDT9_CICAR|nr:uncharacterized protein LOC101493994 [Cicer arietinum]